MTQDGITLDKYRQCKLALILSKQVLLWVYSEAECSRSALKPRLKERIGRTLTHLDFCSTALEDLAEDDLVDNSEDSVLSKDSVLIGDIVCLGLDRELLSAVLSVIEGLGEGLLPNVNTVNAVSKMVQHASTLLSVIEELKEGFPPKSI
jgi:hypothetical protein